jgi:ketosteroid isomerase-like protein
MAKKGTGSQILGGEMSRETSTVIRQRFAVEPRARRRLEERVALRFPRLLAFGAALIWRLPVRSRLRQVVVRRAVMCGWEAMNRVDFESGLALYHEGVESIFDPAGRALGFEDVRGRGARTEMLARVYAEFRDFRFEPGELIYVDHDHLLVVGRMRGAGLASGAAFETEWANLWTISAGKVVRDEVFRRTSAALEAAGLSRESRAASQEPGYLRDLS